MKDLASTAAALVAPAKGILAADESIPELSALLASAGIAPTEANRRAYHEMLLTTPALALLKRHRPDLKISVIVEPRFAEIFAGKLRQPMPPAR